MNPICTNESAGGESSADCWSGCCLRAIQPHSHLLCELFLYQSRAAYYVSDGTFRVIGTSGQDIASAPSKILKSTGAALSEGF